MFLIFWGRYREELRAAWFGYRIPAGEIHLLVSRTVHKVSGAHPVSYSTSTGVLSRW